MKRIRPFLAATATLALTAAAALLPVLVSATPASAATPTCTGTSVVTGDNGFNIRVPTVGNAHPNQFECILGPGDTSTAVTRLQIDLDVCYGDNLSTDGIYGTNTENAIKAVQRAGGLTGAQVDGIYGPITMIGFLYRETNSDMGVPPCTFNPGAI
jgi:peptidoglycan hydrolase-like protein with peptidoglycan-binding domain